MRAPLALVFLGPPLNFGRNVTTRGITLESWARTYLTSLCVALSWRSCASLVVGSMGCAGSRPKDVSAQFVKVEGNNAGKDAKTIVGIPVDELKDAYFLDWSCKTLTEADAKAIANLASNGGLKNLKLLSLSRWQLDKAVLGEDGLKALASVVADRKLPVDQLWLADMK